MYDTGQGGEYEDRDTLAVYGFPCHVYTNPLATKWPGASWGHLFTQSLLLVVGTSERILGMNQPIIGCHIYVWHTTAAAVQQYRR